MTTYDEPAPLPEQQPGPGDTSRIRLNVLSPLENREMWVEVKVHGQQQPSLLPVVWRQEERLPLEEDPEEPGNYLLYCELRPEEMLTLARGPQRYTIRRLLLAPYLELQEESLPVELRYNGRPYLLNCLSILVRQAPRHMLRAHLADGRTCILSYQPFPGNSPGWHCWIASDDDPSSTEHHWHSALITNLAEHLLQEAHLEVQQIPLDAWHPLPDVQI